MRLKNKYISNIAVSFIFLCGAIVLSLVYIFNSNIAPNIFSYRHNTNSVQNMGEVIKGEFTAQENYLGILSVRFENGMSLKGDSVFRIKNILDTYWSYEATISASQFNTLPFYDFGMPIIAKSKNQTYKFEIRLPASKTNSQHFMLSNKYPVLISQYQFPKNILLNNKSIFIEFIIKKLSYYIYGETAWKVFAVYSIPFFLYLLYLTIEQTIFIQDLLPKIKHLISFLINPYMCVIFLGIFIDIFIIRKYTDSTTILFTILWMLGATAYALESRISFGVALIFLIFCPFLLSANMDWVAEKSAVWSYMFLAVGTFQAMIELKAEQSPKLNGFLKVLSLILSFITHIDSFLIARAKEVKRFALFSKRNFAKVVIIFIIASILFFIGFDLYLKALSYRDRQMKNPSIPHIEPLLVYPGTKVVLYGDRFGDNSNNKYALMRDGHRVQVDYWEDHKIIFTVPLDWKQPGVMSFWIEKPIEWNAETVIEKTKPITIKLLKVTDYFTPDDDLYFEQMKTWRKETLEINGYNTIK